MEQRGELNTPSAGEPEKAKVISKQVENVILLDNRAAKTDYSTKNNQAIKNLSTSAFKPEIGGEKLTCANVSDINFRLFG